MGKIDFRALAVEAAGIASDKKALDSVILDIRELTVIADYFVIATAESTPQANAVCAEIEKKFKEQGIAPLRREGSASLSWRALDYGGLLIHIMSPEVRETYNLEKLWNEAKRIKVKDAPIFHIPESKEIKKSVERVTKAIAKAANKGKKKIKKEAQKTVRKAAKKLGSKIKTAGRKIEKGLKKAEKKVKETKKTVKAFGKGIEAFGKALKK